MIAPRNLPHSAEGWSARAQMVAPMAPPWLRTMVARILADTRASSDALLLLADALDEAAVECRNVNWLSLARELRALADEPRMLAQTRIPAQEDAAC